MVDSSALAYLGEGVRLVVYTAFDYINFIMLRTVIHELLIWLKTLKWYSIRVFDKTATFG
jgi:hypothetical protein